MSCLHTEWDAPLVTRIMNAQARLQVALGLARRDEDGQVVSVNEAQENERSDAEDGRSRKRLKHDLNWHLERIHRRQRQPEEDESS